MAEITNKARAKRGMHPNSLKNLRPFGPGNNANPAGRPTKDVSLTSLLKKYLEEVPAIKVGDQVNTKTWRELITQAWLVGAYKGNTTLFIELLNRVEGRMKEGLELSGRNGKAIVFKVIYGNRN